MSGPLSDGVPSASSQIPVAASSLQRILDLASDPPFTPPEPVLHAIPSEGTDAHGNLTLHLVRVPDSTDLFLTTLPPSASRRVTGSDIESSIYYIRIAIPTTTPAASDKRRSFFSKFKSKPPARKDNFSITVIRRNPYNGDQETVAEVESSSAGLIDNKGKQPEATDEGEKWWDLEKPPMKIRIFSPGYAKFTDNDDGTMEREVVFCRKAHWWKKFEKSVKKELTSGHDINKEISETSSDQGKERKKQLGWSGYSFDSPWAPAGPNLERIGASAKWVDWDTQMDVLPEQRTPRCVFEEVVGGRSMKLKLRRPIRPVARSSSHSPAVTPQRAPSPVPPPPPPATLAPPLPEGVIELPDSQAIPTQAHHLDNYSLRPPLPSANSHFSTASTGSTAGARSMTLLAMEFHVPKYEPSGEFVYKTKKERELEASLGKIEKVPQAKVATITVTREGLSCLDLAVTSCVGVAWRRICGWEEDRKGWVG
ncbi:hypothetical protein BJ508DRAFT_417798 [Ascobolus immersus RN42]|uniref:Uncharacterized protein n=1 Tax=Ascobolus immersus RN42 TaxID=1160509 RepID=A0A3N4HQ78_ASCIM|nr:hypothetical protein BJ508DRAFT_417798 [Ascobolus immersus RN42]